jgi:streptogramin lyase
MAGTGLAGSTDGNGNNATFNDPIGVAVDSTGNIFVTDYGNNKVRKITANGVVSTLAGTGIAGSADGAGNAASFKGPFGITIGRKGYLYVTDAGNGSIRKLVY